MRNTVKSISVVVCMAVMISSVNFITGAEEKFAIDDYEFDGINKAVISFNKNIGSDNLDRISIFDAVGKEVTQNTKISIDGDNIEVVFSDIYNSMKYFIKTSEELISEEGETIDEEYSFLLQTEGIREDFNEGGDTSSTWKRTSKAEVNLPANLYDNRVFAANNPITDTRFIYNQKPYTEAAVLIYDGEYENYNYNEKSLLEYDLNINLKGNLGGNYDGISTFFKTVEFKTNAKANDWSSQSLSSQTGAYILRVYDNGQNVELRKWLGDEKEIGAKNASGQYNIGTVLGEKVSLDHEVDIPYRYRIETEEISDGTKITVKRAEYDNNGNPGEFTKVIEYLDTENIPTGGSFYFMTGSSWRAGSNGYFNSFCIDNVAYTNGEWSFSEYTEPELSPEVSMEGLNIKIKFNEPVAMSELQKYVKVYCDEYKKEVDCSIVLDEESKAASVMLPEMSADKVYYLVINKDLKSAMGYKQKDGHVFIFNTKGFYSAQKEGTESTDEWKIFSGSTKNMDAYLNEGMLFVGKNKPGQDLFEGVIYSTGGLMQKDNYEEYMFEDPIIEFDYSNKNMTTVKGNGDYSGLRLMFNADTYINEMGTWDTNISSAGGAYMLTLAAEGSDIKMGLRKWNGDKFAFAERLSNGNIGTELVASKNVMNYEFGSDIRIRVVSHNTGEGERINIYIARYDNGILGEYENVLTFLDTDDPYTGGTFYFTACGSNAAYVNGYISAHHIGNVSYITTEETHNSKMLEIYGQYVEKINKFAEKTSVSSAEYDELKTLFSISNILYENGYTDIAGYEKLNEMRESIPDVSEIIYKDELRNHKVNVCFTLPISDEYFTKDYIKVSCDGIGIEDFGLVKSSNNKSAEITLYNDREYDNVYTVSVLPRIKSIHGMELMSGFEYTFTENKILSSDGITFTDNEDNTLTALAQINNSTSDEQEYFAVLTATVYDDTLNADKMITVQVKTGAVEAYGSDEVSITFEKPDGMPECKLYIYKDSLSLIQMYKTVSEVYAEGEVE